MEKIKESLDIRSKEIAIYFTNGNVQTIKDKEPFKMLGTEEIIVFQNSSYIYTFPLSNIAGLGFKLFSEKTEDIDDGK